MIKVICGDCLEEVPKLKGVTAVVTDPPYGLSFMGKDWDHGVPGEPFWKAIAGCCLPGAPLLAFGGSRTYHRLVCTIEDAGWLIRDTLMWIYGSGFPKSLDVSKAIDKAAGADREVVGVKKDGGMSIEHGLTFREDNWKPETRDLPITAPATEAARLWSGYGTALKPAHEPICLAMNPLDGTFAHNAIEHGVAGLNVDGGRIPTTDWKMQPQGRWPANVIHDGSAEVLAGFPNSKGMSGGGVRKASSTVLPSMQVKGGDSHAHLCRCDSGSAARFFYCAKVSKSERNAGCEGLNRIAADAHNLSSNACSRCGLRVKANGSGKKCECGDLRETVKLPPSKNNHPTVKPLALMRYLLTLVTMPERNLILDPFAGSGTTGVACAALGLDCILIEKDPHHCDIIRARIKHAQFRVERQITQCSYPP